MIKLTDFIKVSNPAKTKIKFNMNASDPSKRALDFLLENNEEWIVMNAWKTKHSNNNLNNADYFLKIS